jgi:hypothetical protein
MKNLATRQLEHARKHRLGSKAKRREHRPDDWHSRSIYEGWEVSGPRWRLGWGGLPEATRHKDRHSAGEGGRASH